MSEDGLDYAFQIDSILLEIDSSLSVYKSYSIISRLNNKELVRTDSMFNTVFLASKKIFNQTDGYFDCSVSPLVNYYGFYNLGNTDSLTIDSSIVRNIVSNIGLDKINIIGDSLVLPKSMKLDFNAIAQGYTVDLISEFLLDQNISNFLVEVGDELLAVDPYYFRPTEVDLLIGDPSKAKNKLGWVPEHDLASLVKDMMKGDVSLMKKDAFLLKGGHEILKQVE